MEYKKDKVKDINSNIYFVIEFYATIYPGDEKQNGRDNSVYQIKILNKKLRNRISRLRIGVRYNFRT